MALRSTATPTNTGPGPGHSLDDAELDAHAKMHLGGGGGSASLKQQLRALRRPTVLLGLLTTLLGYGGVFTSYVYFAPQITEATWTQ